MQGYVFDDDPARIDVDAVWTFLSTSAYWGRWRTRADFDKQLAGAWRVVGCYASDGSQVGFARAVSDGVALAYLADVYVLDAHRGRGLGSELVRVMIEDGGGSEFRWMLHTADAHEVYAKLGFAPPNSSMLERPSRALRLRPLTLYDEAVSDDAQAELAREDFPFLFREPGESFPDHLARLEQERLGVDLPEGRVPATFLVAEVGAQVVGRVSIRHELNDYLEKFGGHIGYCVRPAWRRRGHAVRILRQALRILADLDVPVALVVCDDGNGASAATIERCGGVLRDVVNGVRRYDVPTG